VTGGARGYTLVELLFACGLCATAAAVVVPQLSAGFDSLAAGGAARYVAARLQHARSEALRRNASVAVRFTTVAGRHRYGLYADGNGNGVLSRDILDGVDRAIGPAESLADQFSGVDFATRPGLPAVDPPAPPPGSDPIRFGASDMAVFTAAGTATPGSLYIRGRRAQFVVRVFGDTGKVRILRYQPSTNSWEAR
jgi:type II secretory pathway pseudopilin PulG